MVVSPISRPGQTGSSPPDDAQFLRLFSNEVLTVFHQKNKLMPLQRSRSISNSKSALFPVTGTATAKYHTVGESVFGTDNSQTSEYLSAILSKEREIWVDDALISGTFIPEIDSLKNHFDERAIYVNEVATSLSDQADANLARTLFACALANPATNGFSGMSVADKTIDAYTDATVGASIASFIFDVAQLFDENNIPEEGRIVLLRPRQYYALAAEKDLVNKDWTAGAGDYAQASILKVSGFTIVMTNSLPDSDEATAGALTGERNNPFGALNSNKGYLSPPTTSLQLGAIAFQMDAIATVKMKELSSESQYYMDRQGHLLLSSYMMGHGIIRPECAAWMKSTVAI
jgi:hypothetical protein